MVRHGQKSEPLKVLLESFGVLRSETEECDSCKHYPCWRSLKLTDKWLNDFPTRLRPQIYKRWFSVNGFKFLDLPPELREAILRFAIGPLILRPFARYRCISGRVNSLSSTSNMSLAMVSKQVYNEVMPLFFAATTVYTGTRERCARLFRFGNPTPRPGLSERLDVQLLGMGPSSLLQLLGVSILRDGNRYYYIQKHSEANDVFISVCLNWPLSKYSEFIFPTITRSNAPLGSFARKHFLLS